MNLQMHELLKVRDHGWIFRAGDLEGVQIVLLEGD